MDVRIGVTYTPKEITLEMDKDTEAESIRSQVESAIGGPGVLWLTDKKGRQVGVPSDKVAYVEIGTDTGESTIGFG